jgi:hypothetical protein
MDLFQCYLMTVASRDRGKMNVNVTIQGGLDMIGAAISFVFIAMIACVFDPIEDTLERCRLSIACTSHWKTRHSGVLYNV